MGNVSSSASKRAYVTGASRGIGACVLGHLKCRGYRAYGISRTGPDFRCDLATERVVFNTAHTAVYDLLVLNAGIMPLDETNENDRRSMRLLNFETNYAFLTEAPKIVIEGGSIICIASVAGVIGDVDVPYYAAYKAALINLVRSMALKLIPAGIRVNAISPGFVKTGLVPGDTPQHLLDRVPMKREALPQELLPVVDALIDCPYITGQNIIVDGGLSL